MAGTAGCVFCDGRWTHPESLYGDEHWDLRGLDGPPGWTVLWLRRHAEGILELTPDEVASLGPVIHKVTGAIREATGAPFVYVSVYGEGNPHYHVVLTARGDEIPPEHRGPQMLAHMAEMPRDDERAATVQEQIRELLG